MSSIPTALIIDVKIRVKKFRTLYKWILDKTCVQVLTRLTVAAAKLERNPKRLQEPSFSSLLARKTKHWTSARFSVRKMVSTSRREWKKIFFKKYKTRSRLWTTGTQNVQTIKVQNLNKICERCDMTVVRTVWTAFTGPRTLQYSRNSTAPTF